MILLRNNRKDNLLICNNKSPNKGTICKILKSIFYLGWNHNIILPSHLLIWCIYRVSSTLCVKWNKRRKSWSIWQPRTILNRIRTIRLLNIIRNLKRQLRIRYKVILLRNTLLFKRSHLTPFGRCRYWCSYRYCCSYS